MRSNELTLDPKTAKIGQLVYSLLTIGLWVLAGINAYLGNSETAWTCLTVSVFTWFGVFGCVIFMEKPQEEEQ